MSKPFSEWIGKTRQSYDSMAAETMKRYAATMDRNPALVVDDDPLSPCAHWFYFTPMEALSELAEDGHPHKGDFLPPIELPRRMWAGGRVKNLSALRTGRPATKTSTITRVEQKNGRTGSLCFVTVVHQLEQGGVLCVEEEQDIVYREAAPKGVAPKRGQAMPGRTDWTEVWKPDAVQLFRFSAITFNAHRIHYDADYCRDVEGYPAPVVHGPLLLHRILQAFTSRHTSRCVTHISYRAMGPVYLGETVKVGGIDASAQTQPESRNTASSETADVAGKKLPSDTPGASDASPKGDSTVHSGVTTMFIFGSEGNIGMQAELSWEESI
ncbi:MAG: MaoC family dehydratase N-terminal domain-containing protein [Balneolales bacterium]|nr:MaoC family dehydratase N-terminal domain-containing protein [Balneolales bacterium]